MKAVRLPNGNLRIPCSTESPEGRLGDEMREVEPGTPEFEQWLAHVEGEEDAVPVRRLPDETIDRLRGMLAGLAVGDALGAAVEFRPWGSFAPVTGYRRGPHPIPAGGWTDDTSMALALAKSICKTGCVREAVVAISLAQLYSGMNSRGMGLS